MKKGVVLLEQYDAIVAGAGPAGSTCAFFLGRAGLKVLLLDKARFPRDKTCADNKSWICTSLLKEMGLWEQFKRVPKQKITGMLFSSPGGQRVTLRFDESKLRRDGPHFNVRRKIFDNFVFQAAKRQAGVEALEGFEVARVLKKSGFVVGVEGAKAGARGKDSGRKEQFFAKVVVGADGSESAVARSAGIAPVIPRRHAFSARAYYSGVQCDREMVELHYLLGVLPGYFWIFPVDSNLCNVGVGLPTMKVARENIVLPRLLEKIISSPKFASRFRKAKRVSPFSEWGITITPEKRKRCGDAFLLAGDAGATAVAFAGEGCGPAMRSGKMAAHAIAVALRQNDFSAKNLKKLYEDELWRVMGPENRAVRKLEFLTAHPRVFNFVVGRASRSEKLLSLAGEIASDYRNASKIFSPSTVLRLLFG